jgi:putrescine aminotransferase
LHSSTYTGFGEEAATALEAIRVALEDDFAGRAERIGRRLQAGLEGIAAKHREVAGVRGTGAMQGVVLALGQSVLGRVLEVLPTSQKTDSRRAKQLAATAVCAELYNKHDVLTTINNDKDVALLAAPALIATDGEVDRFVDAVDATLDKGMDRLVAGVLGSKIQTKVSP